MRFFYILLFLSIGVYAQNPKYDLDYYFSEFETPNSTIPTPKEIAESIQTEKIIAESRKMQELKEIENYILP